MLRIGLTGGIGSGKSTVCRLFSRLGVPVIDTDTIAHDLVVPGQPALDKLTAIFGPDILDQEGHLDRGLLRERVFGNEKLREQLESILHPLIRNSMQNQIAAIRAPYVVIAIPLLLEKGWQAEVDRILVIDAPENLQLERTVRRDSVSAETVLRIMHAQVSRQHRLDVADDIIHNDGEETALRAQIENLHKRYLHLAGGP